MNLKKSFVLIDQKQAYALISDMWIQIKPMLVGGHRLVLEVKPEPRSNPQNARLHAMLTELSLRVDWCGKKLPMEVWKRLCMAAWMREERQSPQLVPALDGNGVDIIYERTSRLTRDECGRLMEWITAFAAERGVLLGVDMETGEIR